MIKLLPYFLLLVLFSMFSCVDKEEDPTPEDFILGSWGYSSVVYNGKLIPQGFSDEYNTRWVFNSDGTYYKKLNYYSEDPLSFREGTWLFKENFKKIALKDAISGFEVEWDLIHAKNNHLKVRISTTSKFDHTTTVSEFDMIPAD